VCFGGFLKELNSEKIKFILYLGFNQKLPFMKNKIEKQLEEIKELKWKPFIGERYFDNDKKILLVGESHYTDINETNENFDKIDFTRWIVDEMGIEEYSYQAKFFKNVNRLFVRSTTKDFWNSVSFYNFIQRPMVGIQERPRTADFNLGYNVFVDIIKLLEPNYVIFLGSKCADYLNNFSIKNGYDFSSVTWHDNINGTYLKKSNVTINGKKIQMIFIKHPSVAFNVDKWRSVINTEIPDINSIIK